MQNWILYKMQWIVWLDSKLGLGQHPLIYPKKYGLGVILQCLKVFLTRFETFQTELEQQNFSQILLISYSKSPENFMEKPQMVIDLEALYAFLKSRFTLPAVWEKWFFDFEITLPQFEGLIVVKNGLFSYKNWVP